MIEIVEKLTLTQQYELLKIAHESTDSDVKRMAIMVLDRYLNPAFIQVQNPK